MINICEQWQFYIFLSYLCAFKILFFWLSWASSNIQYIANEKWQEGYPYLIPNLRGKKWCFTFKSYVKKFYTVASVLNTYSFVI